MGWKHAALPTRPWTRRETRDELPRAVDGFESERWRDPRSTPSAMARDRPESRDPPHAGSLPPSDADEATRTSSEPALPPPPGSTAWIFSDASRSTKVPERIGPYRITRILGEGGMGVVYEAEQETPVRRRVALKVIRAGMDTREVAGRFEAERQALALMSHPSIAQVYDAGATEDARPYFAMEYVDGVPITEYCESKRLGARESVELLIRVAEAVQHAHQRGIIHRDLKPSNVLVVERDGAALPKVIDFGIAKALDSDLLGDSTYTQAGQIVGTPAYMSPEQAGLASDGVDTRTDIWALGVILYEVLSCELPFDLGSSRLAGLADLLEQIRSADPLRPSTRLARKARDATIDPTERDRWRHRARRTRGDLDWVVAKALAKHPRDRYATVSELATDLRRWLRSEPVLAGSPGPVYRARKFVRRHRWPVATLAVAVLTLASIATIARYRSLLQAREHLERGDAHARALAAELEKRRDTRQIWDEKRRGSRAWQPVWERREEIAAWHTLGKIERAIQSSYGAALLEYARAADLVPFASSLDVRARRAQEDLAFSMYRATGIEGHDLAFSRDFFRAQITALELGTYDDVLRGDAELRITTTPPGAEVTCFRYVEYDAVLLPLPFDPIRGRSTATDGLLASPVLRVARVLEEGCPFASGDVLQTVNGKRVAVAGDLARAIDGLEVDASVGVTVLRGGGVMELSWTPFPRSKHDVFPEATGRLLDPALELGFTFEGFPLTFAPDASLGRTPSTGHLDARLPRGSYLLVVRLAGHAETRVPVVAPLAPGEPRDIAVRLFADDDAPPGFVPVAAGPFRAGGGDEAYEALPPQTLPLADFFIARYEVTFAEYLEFLNDPDVSRTIGERTAPETSSPSRQDGPAIWTSALDLHADWSGPELAPFRPRVGESRAGSEWVTLVPYAGVPLAEREPTTGAWRAIRESYRERPVLGVSFVAAVEYAAWLTVRSGGRTHFRLPTDLEWEKAARGVDGRRYVWGDYLIPAFAKTGDGDHPRSPWARRPIPPGLRPFDESPYGVFDLTGSADEPTATRVTDVDNVTFYVLRGGSYTATDARDFAAATRNRGKPDVVYKNYGIRLVADIPRNDN